jgi:amino acid transporter
MTLRVLAVLNHFTDKKLEAATILSGVGSVGLTMIYWFIGYLLSQSILSLYLEYASYFPSRSGSEVVYLEQAFPKPKYLIPTIFAAKHVIFSFASSNAVVMAQYIFGIGGVSYTPWQMKGVAVALYTLAYFVVSASTKWSLKLVIWFGIVKILTLVLYEIHPNRFTNFANLVQNFDCWLGRSWGSYKSSRSRKLERSVARDI